MTHVCQGTVPKKRLLVSPPIVTQRCDVGTPREGNSWQFTIQNNRCHHTTRYTWGYTIGGTPVFQLSAPKLLIGGNNRTPGKTAGIGVCIKDPKPPGPTGPVRLWVVSFDLTTGTRQTEWGSPPRIPTAATPRPSGPATGLAPISGAGAAQPVNGRATTVPFKPITGLLSGRVITQPRRPIIDGLKRLFMGSR